MIDRETVDRIMERADILEVVGDYVSLKKRGTSYIGLCPFHNEKSPSFNVSPARGIYKCFGCGKGGNSVNFVMDHEHLSFPDALKLLAKKYHIEIKERELSPEELRAETERESMMIVTEFAQKFFTDALHKTPEGQNIGLSYFRERGFREDTIEKFGLGFSPERRDSLLKAAQAKGYKLDYLIKTGLVVHKQETNYQFDRFAGRVVFPIHAPSGRVTGFGARIMKAADKTVAKYMNSIDSEIYHKGDVLYGYFFAKKAIQQADRCYLVEGYTDVISLHQCGIENVVASSGTSLTHGQIRLVKRFTKNLTILYDGDAAGIKASVRGIDMILSEEMNVKVLLFPDGHDPDSFARSHSSSEVLDFIEKNEMDFIHFKAKLLMGEAQNDPIKRAGIVTDIMQTISLIPNAIIRGEYIKDTSKLLDTKEEVLYSEIQKLIGEKTGSKPSQQPVSTKQVPDQAPEQHYQQYPQRQQYQKKQQPPPVYEQVPEESQPAQKHCERYEKEIIRVMLEYGTVRFPLPDSEDDISIIEFIVCDLVNDEIELDHPVFRRIFDEFYEKLKEGSWLTEEYFTKHYDIEISQIAADLLASPHTLSKIWTKGDIVIDSETFDPQNAIPKLMMEYKDKRIQVMQAQLMEKLKTCTDIEETMKIMEQIKKLKEINMQLSKKLGGRVVF